MSTKLTQGPAPATETAIELIRDRMVLICRHFDRDRGGAERYAVRLAHAASDARLPVSLLGQTASVDLRQRFPFVPVRPPTFSLASKTPKFARLANQVLDQSGARHSYAITRVPHARVARVTDRVYRHWLEVLGSHPWSRWPGRMAQRLWPRSRVLLDLERQFFESGRTQYFIVQSQYERQLIQRYYRVPDEKLRVIHNGVNSHHYRPVATNRRRVLRSEFGYDERDLVILFAAAQHYDHKGLPKLLEALREVKGRVQLLVVGGDRAVPWRRRVDQWKLRDRVRFLPRQSDLRSSYWVADLFALPTLYEPCPNVCLEALACGVPVLTSNRCGVAELIEGSHGAGYVTDPHDVEALRRAIRHFQAQPEDSRAVMGLEARRLAESLTWQHHFDQLWPYLWQAESPERRRAA